MIVRSLACSLAACGVLACELVAPLDDVRPDSVNDAGVDAAASPVLLASGQTGPEYPVPDATHLYWTNADAIMRIAKAGGAPEVVATIGTANEGCALDQDFVYFADRGTQTVQRVPKAGGPAEVLAQNQSFPQEVAVDAQWVYWTSNGEGAVRRAPKAGGPTEDLATGQTEAFALAVSGSDVFWTRATGEVESLAGPLATGGAGAVSLAVDATHVYWVSQSSSGVTRVPRGGGAVEDVGFVVAPEGIALDDTWVYVGQDLVSGVVHRLDPGGGGLGPPVATAQDHPRHIAVDDGAVYWTNSDDGTVYKLDK